MSNPAKQPSTGALYQGILKWILITVVLAASTLLVLSYVVTNGQVRAILHDCAVILFGAFMATVIHDVLLRDYFRHGSSEIIRDTVEPSLDAVRASLHKQIEGIGPDVKEATVRSIEDIRSRVAESADFMSKGITVLSGAKSAGIVGIFPKRYETLSGEAAIDVIRRDLNDEVAGIKMAGISLGDYFLDRGVLNLSLLELLTARTGTSFKIQALLVHPKSRALKERARWEAGSEFFDVPAFYDSTTFIETDGAARIARRLCEKHPGTLEVRLYEQAPTAFVLLTTRFAYIESYHYASRGSNVPLVQVQAGAPLYKCFESHFARLWNVSDPVTHYDPMRSDRDVPVRAQAPPPQRQGDGG